MVSSGLSRHSSATGCTRKEASRQRKICCDPYTRRRLIVQLKKLGIYVLFLLATILVCVILTSCYRRSVIVLPSDYLLHDKSEFPCIPDGYYVISKTFYDELNEKIIICRERLLNNP